MRQYLINFNRLVFLILPQFARIPDVAIVLTACVHPLRSLHNMFLANRVKNLYRLNNNGQICHLRRVLNDAFPDRNASFQIKNIESEGDWLFAYAETTYNQLFFSPEPEMLEVFTLAAIIAMNANFKVFIPNNLTGDDNFNQIKYLVNEYKLVSKKPFYEYIQLS